MTRTCRLLFVSKKMNAMRGRWGLALLRLHMKAVPHRRPPSPGSAAAHRTRLSCRRPSPWTVWRFLASQVWAHGVGHGEVNSCKFSTSWRGLACSSCCRCLAHYSEMISFFARFCCCGLTEHRCLGQTLGHHLQYLDLFEEAVLLGKGRTKLVQVVVEQFMGSRTVRTVDQRRSRRIGVMEELMERC